MSEMTDEQLAEYEEKMAGDDYSSSAPRKAKQFWPSAKRLLGLLAPYKAALTAVFALGTVLGMVVFTALAGAGASILRLERWARYEGAVLGLALIGLGLLVALHQH